MLPPFRLGVGRKFGNGRQWISWVAIDDVVAAIGRRADRATAVGPGERDRSEPVTNDEYTSTLGRVLDRPTLLPAPAPAVRLVLGEFAEELLGGQRVVADRLLESGFEFQLPHLEGARSGTCSADPDQAGGACVTSARGS